MHYDAPLQIHLVKDASLVTFQTTSRFGLARRPEQQVHRAMAL